MSSASRTVASAVPAVKVDLEGRILELDAAWDSRLERNGFELLHSSAMLGEDLWSFLEPRRHEPWKRRLEQLAQEGPPVAAEDTILERLHASRDADGLWLRLDAAAEAAFEEALRQPIFQLRSGHVVARNDAARSVLEHQQGADELRTLRTWLEAQHTPIQMVDFPDLRLEGKPLFGLQPPFPHGDGTFMLLARTFRSGLHDLSNPLAAIRMMAEIMARTQASETPLPMTDVITYLDQAIDVVHRLRFLVHADSAVQELTAASELERAITLVRSEIRRCELEVKICVEEGATLVAGATALRWLVTAGLLATCQRAEPGASLRLELTSIDDSHQFSCHVEPGPPESPECSASPLPANAAGLELMKKLAQTCGGRLLIAPGDRAERDPDWLVEFGA